MRNKMVANEDSNTVAFLCSDHSSNFKIMLPYQKDALKKKKFNIMDNYLHNINIK